MVMVMQSGGVDEWAKWAAHADLDKCNCGLFSNSSDEEWGNRGKALQSALAAKGKHPDWDWAPPRQESSLWKIVP